MKVEESTIHKAEATLVVIVFVVLAVAYVISKM